jgi:hypothetical protein
MRRCKRRFFGKILLVIGYHYSGKLFYWNKHPEISSIFICKTNSYLLGIINECIINGDSPYCDNVFRRLRLRRLGEKNQLSFRCATPLRPFFGEEFKKRATPG